MQSFQSWLWLIDQLFPFSQTYERLSVINTPCKVTMESMQKFDSNVYVCLDANISNARSGDLY